jgi:hypothetical protein
MRWLHFSFISGDRRPEILAGRITLSIDMRDIFTMHYPLTDSVAVREGAPAQRQKRTGSVCISDRGTMVR